MAKSVFFVSATIVWFLCGGLAWASPGSESAVRESAEPADDVQPIDENMAVSPAPTPGPGGKSRPPSARYYPYQQQLTFRTGYDSDFPKIGVDNWVIGFQYLFPKFLSPKLEAGADLIDGGGGHLHAGVRWIHNERSYFRPSLKVGLDHKAEGKDGLATLTEWENYFLRGSACLEFVVWNPVSVRLEHEILINFDKTRVVLTAGISHGW